MHDAPATSPRRGPLLAAAVAVAVLILVAVAAATPRPAFMETLPRPPVTATAPPPVAMPSLAPAESLSPLPIPEEEPFELPAWVDDALVVLLGAGAVVALAWFLFRLMEVSRRPAHRAAVGDGGHAVEIPDLDDEELAEAVQATVESLRRGLAVDDAVIECWRRLERVAAGSGIERRPDQTSEEFTADVLGRGAVDEAPLRDLAGLYRQAMFSTHRLTDDDRERAIAALERLSAQLRGAVRGDA